MSRLNDIIRQVAKVDPQLAKDLQRETDALADRRAFGLNFERHVPEAVELPGRAVRKNDKVRILPERGELPKLENERLYRVTGIVEEEGVSWANLVAMDDPDEEFAITVDGLVVVAEFRDPIYPGLVSTGRVERGGDKPYHAVINAENYHALQALLFTHRGKVDAIYIDPPYNTGARDWKYNNDYVESDDHYRHSKWLAMMERRLVLAKELLNREDSVLIVAIDEKEYARLALLLEQTFPEARIQMITSVISPKGSARSDSFSRCDEYLFMVMLGGATVKANDSDMLRESGSERSSSEEVRWGRLLRRGADGRRSNSPPSLFYPIFFDQESGMFVGRGDSLQRDRPRSSVQPPEGTVAMWPLDSNGQEMRWMVSPDAFDSLYSRGFVRFGRWRPGASGRTPYYLQSGVIRSIEQGSVIVESRDAEGAVVLRQAIARQRRPFTVWNRRSHSAADFGSKTLNALIPGRSFPFPKSLYAVEDTLRFFLQDKPEAVVLDYFAGSGTTGHAVMRLNRKDGGRRQCISVTNNEVSADEQRSLQRQGLRRGDPEWESLGICDHITKPRLIAATTGLTPSGEPIKGDYTFNDEFPMAEGIPENTEFFVLTYESGMRVASNREFSRIAPFLWLRAGSSGRRIDDIADGWGVAETYGVIGDLDQSEAFIKAVESQEALTHAFIITDEDRLFEDLVRQLPERVEPVRLYASYMRNFEIEAGRASR